MDLKEIEELVIRAPLLLTSIKDKNIISLIEDNYLSFSIGLEFETFVKDSYKMEIFENIPGLIRTSIDSEEQRYRIPSGINGLICLYLLCREIKNHCELDTESAIHYHIDMSQIFKDVVYKNQESFIHDNKEWILNEFDTWGKDVDNYNRRIAVNNRCWINFQSQFNTMEVRIGEMTFDYEIIIKRILHCCAIVRQIYKIYEKQLIVCSYSPIITIEEILQYNSFSSNFINSKNSLLELLKDFEDKEEIAQEFISKQEIKNIVNQRVVKI